LSLNFTTSTSTIGYIILQRTGNVAPTGTPLDGTAYTAGSALGDGTVAAVITTNISSVSISGLTPSTQYSFTIIPFGKNGTNAESYNYYLGGTVPSLTVSTLTDARGINSISIPVTENFDAMGNRCNRGFTTGLHYLCVEQILQQPATLLHRLRGTTGSAVYSQAVFIILETAQHATATDRSLRIFEFRLMSPLQNRLF
jgi:hypothetical protein